MATNPEHCFYISDPADLKFFFNSPYQRIYFGNEFCEFLMPTRSQLQHMLDFAASADIPLALTTPACTDRALAHATRLIHMLPPGSEVVFNDWGVLESIRAAHMAPVHGRLLCHAKKDPRLTASKNTLPHATIHNIQSGYQKMLIDNAVTRVELDNVYQGLSLSPDPRIKFSLHYPFVPCTVTRKCYFANMALGNRKFRTITECGIFCRGENIPVHNTGEPLYMKGNAQYYVNSAISASPKGYDIDRYVFTPVLPNHNFTHENALYLDWNQVFKNPESPKSWGDEPDTHLIELLEQTGSAGPALNVLDIGCGTGRHAALFAEHNYHGVDISPYAIDAAQRRHRGIFFQGNILDPGCGTDFPGFFDTGVDYGCFHAIPPHHRRRYFENVHRIMKPGALLVVCAWFSSEAALPVYFVNEQLPEWSITPDILEEEARDLFEVLRHTTMPCTERAMMYAVLKSQ
jgi:SAM-dependent methyltransferase